MNSSQTDWHIVQQSNEQCIILTDQALQDLTSQPDIDSDADPDADSDADPDADPDAQAVKDSFPLKTWGPFKTQNQAIAKRIGLIRSGKCKPV
ncbi:MAG: hypothetical protein AAFR58_14000 [Cyanobacteria bacterium J06627_28]